MKSRWLILGMVFLFYCGLGRAQSVGPGPLSLNLDDCIKVGLENNLQVKMAESQVDYAEGKVTSTRSYLMPTVKASGLYTHMNTLPQFVVGNPTLYPTSFPVANGSGTPLPPDHVHLFGFPSFEMSNDREGDVYQAKIEMTYPVFTGFRTTEGYKAAKFELDVAKADLESQKQDLVYQIRQSYYQVLLAKEMVKVIDDSYDLMAQHSKQVKDLYREGYVSNLDVLQVEAKLSAITPQQIQVHNGYELAQLQLKNVLNLDPAQPMEVLGELKYEELKVPELNEQLLQARASRPDLKSLELREDQTQAAVKIAQGGFYPTVAVFANYQWNRGQDLPPNDKVWRPGYQAGATASIDLFDGFQTLGEVKAAKSQRQQVIYGEEALSRGIEIQVTAAYLQFVSAQQGVEAESKNVEAAQKNLEASQNRYREGMVNHLDVLDAEVGLTSARANYLRALNNYYVAKAGMDKAMGIMEVE